MIIHGLPLHVHVFPPSHVQDAALYVREGEDNEKFASHPNGWFSKKAYHIVHNPLFYTIDFIATVLLLLLALIEDPPVVNIPERWKAVVVTVSVLF